MDQTNWTDIKSDRQYHIYFYYLAADEEEEK